MRGIVLTTLMIIGILVFAGTAIGVSYAKYDEATTTVTIEDGLKCTINGKAVSNGDVITTKLDGGYLKVCVESEFPAVIGCFGVWYTDGKTVTENKDSTDEVTCYEFKIPFNHGDYNGSLLVRNMGSDAYGCPISMVLHFDESKVRVWFSLANSYRHDGETVWVLGECEFDVLAVDGQTHTFSWDGSWGNDVGDHGVLKGTKTTSEVALRISSYQSLNAPSEGEITFTYTD